ncbi:GNAT family N-acetyltransferase [Alkaliphilus peptidifermentans]|uniref:Acetyltransferase (GNAT) family protein n=1 Tax=Alkaliphilus peptidifermentans DSM 18978 TaxID=1120976 RepID=A0A1G5C1V7_9FIRM|nr:GNAT family N-acetyltransferase [Alkaliphilus peptidifermentans]SCX96415.1 Acetyltransferase (GNAT) family protein [Alkaliphilus peptidifermentans DSM 18978]
MTEKLSNPMISLKQYISEKDFKEINQLRELCFLHDKTNLKLELDYKLNISRNTEVGLNTIDEFLYYNDEALVAYLGISSFGGSNVGEINGMVHPDFRRKGLFKKLFELAIDECRKRRFNKLLLLTDGNSNSGIEFIKAVKGEYDFSEYRMRLINKNNEIIKSSISLREAGKHDRKEIARQNSIYFNHSGEFVCFPEEEEQINETTYMVELEEAVIGKIKVEYSDNSAFISGFGILPDYRGKGYGKEALKVALWLINGRKIYETELDVECKNKNALDLYKDCGFKEQSVMNYYNYQI